jgi:hypothetical protein
MNTIHKGQTQLLKSLKKIRVKVKVGNRYFHYKHPDQPYHVVAVGFIEETLEPAVVYEGEFGERFVWIRTLSDFLAKVKLEDGNEVDRFTKIE